MKFCEKLKELRRQKGLTQEELAAKLFVSRTAVSKWESGKGYPNIESLKAIACFFEITVDELLSGDELLTLAEEDTKQHKRHFKSLVFAFLDLSVALLLFLPFFAQTVNGTLYSVSLLKLTEIAPYLKVAYFTLVFGIFFFGILTLALQTLENSLWLKVKNKISLGLTLMGALLFVISLQPYAAVFLLSVLAIKVLILINKR